MTKLDDLLAKEETAWRREELFLRHFAFNVKGRDKIDVTPLVESHLKDCSGYFLKHGTIDGPRTPWMIANGRMPYGEEEEGN